MCVRVLLVQSRCGISLLYVRTCLLLCVCVCLRQLLCHILCSSAWGGGGGGAFQLTDSHRMAEAPFNPQPEVECLWIMGGGKKWMLVGQGGESGCSGIIQM